MLFRSDTETLSEFRMIISLYSSPLHLLPLLPDHAVPRAVEVPAGPEEEIYVRGPDAPPAGSVLRGSASSAALHHRGEDEDDDDEGQAQGGVRGNHGTGAGVRRWRGWEHTQTHTVISTPRHTQV